MTVEINGHAPIWEISTKVQVGGGDGIVNANDPGRLLGLRAAQRIRDVAAHLCGAERFLSFADVAGAATITEAVSDGRLDSRSLSFQLEGQTQHHGR